MIGREDEVREYRDRVKYVNFVFFLALCLIGARLVYLQIMKGDELRKYSDANRLKKEKLQAGRGIIYDRNGKVIVDNRASFDVVLLSQYYNFNHKSNIALAKALQLDPKALDEKLTRLSRNPSFYPLLLKADVTKDIIAAVEMGALGGDFKGVDIEPNVQRRYPLGDVSAQLLGYTGEVDPRDIANDPKKRFQPGDFIGKMGIERAYDAELRGTNGVGYVEVDSMGRRKKVEGDEKLLGFVAQTEPVAGENLHLTLDIDLEKAAADAMKSRGFSGSIVAIDPRTGEILALVSYPSYDPTLISGREINSKVWNALREDKDRPLRNRAIQDHYPPGSTFKLFMAIAGLQEKATDVGRQINCNGAMFFGKRNFNCWKRHGPTDFVRAIKESCDVYFYNVGLQLGVDKIAKYARLFGLGARTGLKLPGEQAGLIPDSEWKEKVFKEPWQAGETLSVSIGQGYVDVTPLQLANAYAAISNGGFLYRPYLVKKIEGRNGEAIKEFAPELTRKIDVGKEVFDTVKEGLYRVINEPGGTAVLSKSKKTILSGKTGTAQVRAFSDIRHVSCPQMDYKDRHHGWFVGYAPRENPEIAVAAIAEHQCHGSTAAHLVTDVVDAYMDKYHPAPATTTKQDVAGSGDAAGVEKAPRKVAGEAPKKSATVRDEDDE
jgi:penicillin-binding protein 2